MRKIAATYVFPVNSSPLKNGILNYNNNGTIINIIGSNKNIKEQAGLEYYSGILTPGFVKTHCFSISEIQEIARKHTKIDDFFDEISNSINLIENNALTNSDRKALASGLIFAGQTPENNYSVITELLFIQKTFPDATLNHLVTFVCLLQAKARQVEKMYGTLEKGKAPGLNLITGIDFKEMKLTEKAKVKRLM